MITRRHLLQALPSLPFIGGFFGSPVAAPPPAYRDFYAELGLRTFINAAGTLTFLSGSLMRNEVAQAMEYARHHYVRLDDIEDRVGERIASLLGCEAAVVTAGAASAMTLGTAGVLTGMDEEKVVQLPDVTGMKRQVIVQKAHRVSYLHAIRNTGVDLVFVETRRELEAAINDETAMLLFINAYNFDGEVRDEEFASIGKKHGIPTFNDCAADVPPVENLWRHTDLGFDLVAFSGGKGIRGPQSAGLLLGRKALIAAARLHMPPRGDTLGRGMKVNKEEVLGMLVALECYVATDHEKEWDLWESQIRLIEASVAAVPGTLPEYHVPPVANHVPTLRISWDAMRIPITPDDVRTRLRLGHPSIEVGGDGNALNVATWMMRPGEERIVASRISEILKESSS